MSELGLTDAMNNKYTNEGIRIPDAAGAPAGPAPVEPVAHRTRRQQMLNALEQGQEFLAMDAAARAEAQARVAAAAEERRQYFSAVVEGWRGGLMSPQEKR